MACCAATSRAACRVQPSSGYLVPKILSPSWPRRGIMWPTPQRYAQTLALSNIVLAQRRVNSGGERGSVVVRPLQTGPPLTAMGSFRRSVELADPAIVGLPPSVVRPVLLSSCIFHRQATGRLSVRPPGFLGAANARAGSPSPGSRARPVRSGLRAPPPGAAELGHAAQARVGPRPGALPELRWRAEDHCGDP